MLQTIAICILVWLTSFCCLAQDIMDSSEMKRRHVQYINHPDTIFNLQELPICFNYGCKEIANAKLTNAQWEKIISLLIISSESAADERNALTGAIGYIESIIGEQTNTEFDLGGTFNIYLNLNNGRSEQMDCIDESTNTLLYLRIIEQHQKIIWHEVLGVISRGGIISGYPHTAVLLQEKQTKQKYIIDSWFHDNGYPAEVVPYATWKKGWKPNKEK